MSVLRSIESKIADPSIRTRVVANDYAALLQLNYTQDPRSVARLYELKAKVRGAKE